MPYGPHYRLRKDPLAFAFSDMRAVSWNTSFTPRLYIELHSAKDQCSDPAPIVSAPLGGKARTHIA